MSTYLVFVQVIREVGNHDLVFGWDSVSRRAALTALAWLALGLLALGVSSVLVGNVRQSLNLSGAGSGSSSGGDLREVLGSIFLLLDTRILVSMVSVARWQALF